MAGRFEDVGDEILEFVNSVKKEYFPELKSATIKVMFDTKKKTSKGRLQIATISKTNELQRYLTIDESNSTYGYDYFLYLDQMIWNNGATTKDKERIVRHTLQYTDVDMEKENPYILRGCEVMTFYDEIERNKDDPEWEARLMEVGISLYEQAKKEKKE